jgi:type III secretion protein R
MGDRLFTEPLSLFLALSALAMLPLLAVLTTSFAKIQIVLMLTRNALGVQSTPPSLVINALALIITCYVMAPVAIQAYTPLKSEIERGSLPTGKLIVAAAKATYDPLRAFLAKHAHEREADFFMSVTRRMWPADLADSVSRDDLSVLIPAFLLSQLSEAFVIGMIIYVVFIVIDFIVAAVLLALGMSMISPTVVSVPFKLLLFIATDGWSMLLHNLILSYE